MVENDKQPVDRRQFLELAAASGGVAGLSALAGCSGDSDTTDDGAGGGGSDQSNGEAGEALPAFSYYNNPAGYNPSRHDAINLIGDQLSKLGLDVSVEVFEWGTLYTRVRNERNFDFCTWHHLHDIYPGLLMNEFFNSTNTDPGAGNFSGWSSEETDQLLKTALSSSDEKERVDAMHSFETAITKAAPVNPIVQMPSIVAFNSDQVSGWVDHVNGPGYFYNMTQIAVDNQKNQLRGSWSETIGTLNVVGAPAQTKVNHQLDVLYDKLIRFDGDLAIAKEAGLASDWERPDRTTVRYTLKEHSWHDGEPVTAEDAAFTFNYIKKHEAPRYATQIAMYDDAEAVDERTVQVNLTDGNAPGPVHLLLASQVPIIPKHRWESRDTPLEMQVNEPVGSGVLAFDYWEKGSELSLVKNEEHFFPVNFDSRIWRIVPEISTTWTLLREGELNYLPFSRIGKQLHDNQDRDQIGVYQMPGNGWWHCSMNTRRPGLDDRALRQAVVSALPKSAIVQQILYDFPEEGFNLVNESFEQYHNADVPRYKEGVDVGKQKLREAGYVLKDGKLHFPAE